MNVVCIKMFAHVLLIRRKRGIYGAEAENIHRRATNRVNSGRSSTRRSASLTVWLPCIDVELGSVIPGRIECIFIIIIFCMATTGSGIASFLCHFIQHQFGAPQNNKWKIHVRHVVIDATAKWYKQATACEMRYACSMEILIIGLFNFCNVTPLLAHPLPRPPFKVLVHKCALCV